MEYRTRDIQFRADTAEDGKSTAVGRAIVYGEEVILWEDDEFQEREVINPGAAMESIATDDIRALWNHRSDIVLGRKKQGTLRIAENPNGVDVEIDFPDSEEGRSKFASVRRGDVDQMSIGFDFLDVKETREIIDGKRVFRREVKKMKLWEVSPVTFPAYENTSIQARRERVRAAFEGAPSESHNAAALQRDAILRDQEIQIMEAQNA